MNEYTLLVIFFFKKKNEFFYLNLSIAFAQWAAPHTRDFAVVVQNYSAQQNW